MLSALKLLALLPAVAAEDGVTQTAVCSYAQMSRVIMRMDAESGNNIPTCTRACKPFGDAACAADCFVKGGLSNTCGKCFGSAISCIIKASPDAQNSVCKDKCESDNMQKCQQCLMDTCSPDFTTCANIQLPIDYFINFHGICDADQVRKTILGKQREYAACLGGKCQGNAECIATNCLKPDFEDKCATATADALQCIFENSPVSGKDNAACTSTCTTMRAADATCQDCLMSKCNPQFSKKTGMTFPYVEFFDFAVPTMAPPPDPSPADVEPVPTPDAVAPSRDPAPLEIASTPSPDVIDAQEAAKYKAMEEQMLGPSIINVSKGVKVKQDACMAKDVCSGEDHYAGDYLCGVGMSNRMITMCETTSKAECEETCNRSVNNADANARGMHMTEGDIGYFCGTMDEMRAKCPDPVSPGDEISV